MASRLRRWRSATGIASTILGVFFLALLLMLAVSLTTYQQIAATRQVVATTATAALRSAVPGAFLSEGLANAHSHRATNLLMSATAYNLAVGHILPEYWPGAKVQACLATPAGSPAPCTPGNSYLVTLPAATADALHIAGPMVVTNVQLATTAPYRVTHFGTTTKWPEPVTAADVAVPLRLSIGSLINIRPWVEVSVTNVLYADQGGQTGGNARFIAYGTAPAQGSSSTASIGCGSWNAPSYFTPLPHLHPCSTRPNWCPPNATYCILSIFSAPTGGVNSGSLAYPDFGNLMVLYGTSSSWMPSQAKPPSSMAQLWASYVAGNSSPRPTPNYCWRHDFWVSDLSPNYPYLPMSNWCTSPPTVTPPSWADQVTHPDSSYPSYTCYGNKLYGSNSTLWVCGDPPP